MNDIKTFAKEWIAALRSGKYEQMKSYLGNVERGRYCCLGVGLCVQAEMGGRELSIDDFGYIKGEISETLPGNYLPAVRRLDTWDLSYLNDILGFNFDLIADMIEAYPDVYLNGWPEGERLTDTPNPLIYPFKNLLILVPHGRKSFGAQSL